MKQDSLFISNYCRIEDEVIKCMQYITFDDSQLNVYSPILCDLIIRCSIDIEAIYKLLHQRNINQSISSLSIGKIIRQLDEKLDLIHKKIILANNDLHFNKLKLLQPFNYNNGSNDDFYSTFCSLKHDRAGNIQRATVYTLMLSLSALYILNQYLLDETTLIENSFFGEIFPDSMSKYSKLFSVPVFNQTNTRVSSIVNNLRTKKINEQTIEIIEEKLEAKTNCKKSKFAQNECLYEIVQMREYGNKISNFIGHPIDENRLKPLAIALLGDEKDYDVLLDELGLGALLPIIQFLQISCQRYRFCIKINYKN